MRTECPHCGVNYKVDHKYLGQQFACPECGKGFQVQNSSLFPCPDCDALISKRAAVCPRCGAPVGGSDPVSEPPEQNKNDISQEKNIEIFHPAVLNYFWLVVFSVICIPIIIGIFMLIWVIIEIKCTSYELTSHRIIVRKGWLSKTHKEIWIKDMRAVDLVQGIWQRMIGVGDVAIGTAATAGAEISISGVENPEKMIDKINSLR